MRDLFNLESIRSREKDLSSYSEEEKSALCQRQKKGKNVRFFFFLKKKEITFTLFARLKKKKRLSIQSTKRHAKASSVFCCCCCYDALGVRTRAQKRRMGERDVWDLIVNNDDICFKHILPRLNGTDVKFLYEVNTETRKLIKRSSRAGDLKKKFKLEEMSSISTLEVAWENKSLWPRDWIDEEIYFCWQVAGTNKLELLKWAREEKKCEWDGRID